MHIPRFNAYPAHQIKRNAIHKAAAEAARGSKDATDREFRRLCGAMIVLAEQGRDVTADTLIGEYGFKATFLQTHSRRAAEHVAQTMPALAEAVGHMKGAQ